MKLVWKILLGVVIVLILAVVLAIVFINQIARSGVQFAATRALGVQTTLGSLHIGILSGHVSMGNLAVANPANMQFTTPDFLALKSGSVDVSLGSLLGNTVVVPHLELDGLSINLEKNKDGQANYDVILAHMKSQESTSAQPASQKPGKKFVIKELVIKNLSVQAQMPLTSASMPVKVDEIVLHDVGSGGNMNMSEVAGVVVKASLASALSVGKDILPSDISGDLGKGLGGLQSLASQGVSVAGNLGQQIGNIGGGAAQAAEQAGKSLTQGLGGLFGGSKTQPKK